MKDTLRQLFRDVRSQKLRTMLTVFGIVWGTVAVTLLLAFGRGLHKQIVKNSAGLGDRIAIAWPALTSIPFEGLGRGRRIRVREERIEAVRRETPGVVAISSEYSDTLKLHYGLKTVAVDASGVDSSFGKMRNLIPQAGGRFLNALDVAERRRVLFLGDKIARDIFGKSSPVGKTVLYGGSPRGPPGEGAELELQQPRRGARVHGRDDLPRVDRRQVRQQLRLSAGLPFPVGGGHESGARDARARAAIRSEGQGGALGLGHGRAVQVPGRLLPLLPPVSRDRGVFHADRGRDRRFQHHERVVEERTKEIGIKMALGARQRWILRQFLLETLLITAGGGAIGFLISFGICLAVPKLGATEFVGDPEISVSVAALTALVLGATGLLAGYFPAEDAARLDPVVAMKL